MTRLAARLAGLPRELAAYLAALPQRRQEQVQDAMLGVTLAAVNVFSLLLYRSQLHPLWLALVLVAAQGIPLIWRRYWRGPVGVMILIGVARVAYDRIGFGFAPLPLGPAIAFYTVIDRCGPVWRWLTIAGVAAGTTVSLTSPGSGNSEPYQAIFQAMIFAAAFGAGVLSRAKRANLAAAQSRADRAEAELDRSVARERAAERARIARELHDVVAHHVSLMAVQAEAATSLLPDKPVQARKSVEIIGDTARLALTELRRLLGVLRGPSERLETAPSASLGELDSVLDQVRGAGLPVDFEVVGTPGPLAPGIDLTAYRIVQEALTNTIRHAHAAYAAVTLSYEPRYITVRVADSGPRPDGVAGNGDAIGQRAQRRGLVQGAVRPVRVAEVLVLAQDGHQVALVPYQGLVQQLTPAAPDPAFHDRVHSRRLDSRADGTGASGLEDGAERGGEACVPVMQDDPPDRGRRHRDAGSRELAVDPAVSPRPVLPGQPQYHRPHLAMRCRAPGAAPP